MVPRASSQRPGGFLPLAPAAGAFLGTGRRDQNMKPTYDELLAALAKMTDRYHRAILATGALDWVACAAIEDAVDLIARAADSAPLVMAPAPTENSGEVAAPLRWPGWPNEHKAQRNAEIAQRYQQGVPMTELAAEYGITATRVHQILDKLGARSGKNVKKVKSQRNAEIAQRYQQGVPMTELAAEYGITATRVYQILDVANSLSGKDDKQVKFAERTKEAIRLRELGLSYKAIAEEVGVRSVGHIHNIIEKHRPDLLGSRAAMNGALSDRPAV